MPDRHLRRAAPLALLALLHLTPPTASATIIDVVLEGQPPVVAAISNAKAEGIKLLKQAGTDLVAALAGQAWTWDYAFAFPREEQVNDTTLNLNTGPPLDIVDNFPHPTLARAQAEESGWFSRYARATGSADMLANEKSVDAVANRFSVAKSFAGIGRDFETKGARLGAVILAKLVKIALDPPLPLYIPGPDILDPLPDSTDGSTRTFTMPLAPLEMSPAGFDYSIGYFDPFGIETILLDMSGRLIFDPSGKQWKVALDKKTVTAGTTGLPDADDFVCDTTPGGAVSCEYTAGTGDEIRIPFSVSSSWDDDTTFSIYSQIGVFAQAVDQIPEPGAMVLALTALGLAGLRLRSQR